MKNLDYYLNKEQRKELDQAAIKYSYKPDFDLPSNTEYRAFCFGAEYIYENYVLKLQEENMLYRHSTQPLNIPEKKVRINTWVHGNNLWNQSSDIEEFLYKKLSSSSDYKNIFELLSVSAANSKRTIHQEIYQAVSDYINIDFDFAKSLQLYDSISSYCFYSDSEIGKAFIEILFNSEIVFILFKRSFLNTNLLELDFEAVNQEDERQLHAKLTKGGHA